MIQKFRQLKSCTNPLTYIYHQVHSNLILSLAEAQCIHNVHHFFVPFKLSIIHDYYFNPFTWQPSNRTHLYNGTNIQSQTLVYLVKHLVSLLNLPILLVACYLYVRIVFVFACTILNVIFTTHDTFL